MLQYFAGLVISLVISGYLQFFVSIDVFFMLFLLGEVCVFAEDCRKQLKSME